MVHPWGGVIKENQNPITHLKGLLCSTLVIVGLVSIAGISVVGRDLFAGPSGLV